MNKETSIFYNQFSFLYPLVDVLLKRQKKLLFSEVNALPEGKLLEIGVGNGTHLQQYKKHKVTGIDTSAVMLETARKNASGNIRLLEMDGEALLFDDQTFDYIVLSHVIAVVDDADELLQEVNRVLKPNGLIFILNHFTPHNWLRYLDRGFIPIGKLLHFRSFFRIQDLLVIGKFRLRKEINIGALAYFKLLIYQK